MYASDVQLLIDIEATGEQVISWFAKDIWNLRKTAVTNSETALRLSKILRDNRHTYMHLLKELLDRKFYTFLASLLHLDAANFDPEFVNLGAKDHLTKFDSIIKKQRTTKYTIEQKARRIRVAFTALCEYHQKENRSAFIISNSDSRAAFSTGFSELEKLKHITTPLDQRIAITMSKTNESDLDLRELANSLTAVLLSNSLAFSSVQDHLLQGMRAIGKELDSMWSADRYVRSAPEDIIE